MKNKLYIIIGTILVIGLVGFGTSYLLSLRKASFVFKNGATAATVYRPDKSEVKRISPGDSLLLRSGSYTVVPQGPNLSQEPISISVTERSAIYTIEPDYSAQYLSGLVSTETPAVTAAISAKYPSTFDIYTLERATFYSRGEWFGGLLKPRVSDVREQKDSYRIVLNKKNGEWEVVRRPEYILTLSRYENVPVDILRSINSIVE